ncbi:hypothetical protein ANCCAN_04173, partial [Ancylostoma caninum]
LSREFLFLQAIYLLLVAAEGIRDCEGGQRTTRKVLQWLAEEVSAKLKEKKLEYDCKLEKYAYDFARTGRSDANLLVSKGPEDKFNVRAVVKSWEDQLPAVGTQLCIAL